MAITYTTFLTENPTSNIQRIYRGYLISGVGVVLNVIVKINPSQGDNRVSDKEVFIPGATLASFSGMSWTTVDTVNLGNGQKRVVRNYTIPAALGTLIELLRTVKYSNQEQAVDVSIIHAV
jgi:hypothetical protein